MYKVNLRKERDGQKELYFVHKKEASFALSENGKGEIEEVYFDIPYSRCHDYMYKCDIDWLIKERQERRSDGIH